MTTDVFTTWVNFVLEHEGGLTDDPHDPGGLTNFGIDQRSHPGVNIRALTRDGAVAIYRTAYWLKSQADKLPSGLDVIYADAAVNQGLGEAAILLQQALQVKIDGHIGPATLARASAATDLRAVVAEFAARRAVHYATTGGFTRYGLGWMRRLADSLELALSLMEVPHA